MAKKKASKTHLRTAAEALGEAVGTILVIDTPLMRKPLAQQILDALPQEVDEDGRVGEWVLTLWWEPESPPALIIDDESS